MSVEDQKPHALLLWVISLAFSVVCCSALFVVFAGRIVDVQSAVTENNLRINSLQRHQDEILTQLEVYQKRGVLQPLTEGAAPAAEAAPAAPVPMDSTSTTNDTTAPAAATIQVPTLPAATTAPAETK